LYFTIISPSFFPATYYGGPIFSTYELAKAIKQQGIDIKVITTNANGKEKLKLTTGIFHYLENDLPVKYYQSLDSKGTSVSMVFNLWKDIREADLVYLVSVFSFSTPLTLICCKFLNKPLIISPRGQLGEWCLKSGSRFKKLWLKLFIKPFAYKIKWHVTSQQEKNKIETMFPGVHAFIVPNGIDLKGYNKRNLDKDKAYFKKFGAEVNSDSSVIVSMGRLHTIKGFDILIDAFAIFQKKNPNSFLFIAGEDYGEQENLDEKIKVLGLGNKVFLVGQINDLNEKVNILSNADVFALASHNENFGMVYAEALAVGTPIVAGTNTPWQDAEEYGFGKWVDNTPEKFAEAIAQVLNSDVRKMGEIGKRYIEVNFNWEKIARLFIENIKSISSTK
jgi:glycosyltransferase involved in cell wall biosynthesis